MVQDKPSEFQIHGSISPDQIQLLNEPRSLSYLTKHRFLKSLRMEISGSTLPSRLKLIRRNLRTSYRSVFQPMERRLEDWVSNGIPRQSSLEHPRHSIRFSPTIRGNLSTRVSPLVTRWSRVSSENHPMAQNESRYSLKRIPTLRKSTGT